MPCMPVIVTYIGPRVMHRAEAALFPLRSLQRVLQERQDGSQKNGQVLAWNYGCCCRSDIFRKKGGLGRKIKPYMRALAGCCREGQCK